MALRARAVERSPGLWIVLYGDPGSGKTTLSTLLRRGKTATLAMEQVDISYAGRADDILVIDPYDANGAEASPEELVSTVEAMASGAGDFADLETIIIDSLSALDALVTRKIIDRHRKGDEVPSLMSIAGGYGKGVGIVENVHSRIESALKKAVARGMRVILTAHPDIEEVTRPDGSTYSRYGVAVHKMYRGRFLNEASLVARLTADIATTDGKAIKISDCILVQTTSDPTRETKNRIGIKEVVRWTDPDANPLSPWLSGVGEAERAYAPFESPGEQQIVERMRSAVCDNSPAGDTRRAGMTEWLTRQGYTPEQISDKVAQLEAAAAAGEN